MTDGVKPTVRKADATQAMKDFALFKRMQDVLASVRPTSTARVEIMADELAQMLELVEMGQMLPAAEILLARKDGEYRGIRLSLVAMVDAVGGEVTIQYVDLVQANPMDLEMTENKEDKSWTYRTKKRRPFDPQLNCPTHFAGGDPSCPACQSKQQL